MATPAFAAPVTHYVSKTGTDTGTCTKAAPCATLQYAVDQAAPKDVVSVAAGTYKQTVNITKPLTLAGAGAGKTIIDGSTTDEQTLGYFGVVQISRNTSGVNGTVSIHGFTIRGAYLTQAEADQDSSPIDLAVYQDSGDGINVAVHDNTFGAPADPADFGGIGLYTFNSNTVTATHNTFTGMFQGALLEGTSGLQTLTGNTFTKLIELVDNSTNPATTYPAEGAFLLSDEAGTAHAVISNNHFTMYRGYGIAARSGYDLSNCTSGCTGSAVLKAQGNTFALGSSPAAAIALKAINSGDNLTATLTKNTGYVTAPAKTITVSAGSGASTNVTQNNNHIVVHAH